MIEDENDQQRITNMRYLREALSVKGKKFTQAQAAKILNVSRNTIIRCENGEIEPVTTFECFQSFQQEIRERTGVDIGMIPGFRFSDSSGQEIFAYYLKLNSKRMG
jgi:DNA-binding XRE family transcriptional regulator